MKRREFITLLGGAAVAWPLAARGQQSGTPVIGFLASGTPELSTAQVAEFRAGLKEVGFVENQNVAIEFSWARNQRDRLLSLAADLVRRNVTVIVSTGGNTSALAAKAATTTIPIVFTMGDDPVRLGIVASVNRPGGNLTGASFYSGSLGPKRLELLHELVPSAQTVGFLIDPTNPEFERQLENIRAAANSTGQQLLILPARTDNDIHAAYATVVKQRIGTLLVGSSANLFERMDRIVALAIRYAVPACYYERQFVEAGGLMSYGARRSDAYHQAGIYTGKILKGERPADMPIVFPTRFELVINRRTAKVIDLDVPPTLLARADEVIE
jgi:putative tryptophan/tyrosine transport system substrate-binding protein